MKFLSNAPTKWNIREYQGGRIDGVVPSYVSFLSFDCSKLERAFTDTTASLCKGEKLGRVILYATIILYACKLLAFHQSLSFLARVPSIHNIIIQKRMLLAGLLFSLRYADGRLSYALFIHLKKYIHTRCNIQILALGPRLDAEKISTR